MGAIDFDKVNVQVTSAGGTTSTIGHVKDKASCDPTRGGWTYDVDPATGQIPTTIIACDATCAQLMRDATARIDIVLGCQTIVITLDDRVERSAALPRGAHRGRVWEPFEGSHEGAVERRAAQRSGCSRRS